MVGQKYGHLTVTEMLYHYQGQKRTFCKCDCDCGKTGIVRNAYDLRNRSTEFASCGCAKKACMEKACARDIDGIKFGRLTVLETLWDESPPKVRCQCDCGNIVILRKSDVQSMHTQSCGCWKSERIIESNTKDWTGVVSDYGVELMEQSQKNDLGQWLWKCKCPICGGTFEALPAKIMDGSRTSCGCKSKTNSSGEQFIANVLTDSNTSFIRQYTFDDCKNIYKLRFDFAVFKNDKVFCLIEYNGEQHYKPIDYFGGEEDFEKRQTRDQIKIDYCKDNNLPLYIFRYDQSCEEIRERLANIINP